MHRYLPAHRYKEGAIYGRPSAARFSARSRRTTPRVFKINTYLVGWALNVKEQQKILVIVGPTSSGKSALAIRLAKKFRGEVISADSRQVYRGLDIGTGKITKREMNGVPHHLLDVISPKKTFTAHDFVIHSKRTVAQIKCRGKLPIICGGTGFYIDALLGRITLPDVPANHELRATLDKKTVPELFTLLKKKDSRCAKTIDRYNKRRLIRALEIAAILGKSPPTRFHLAGYDTLWVGLSPSQDVLRTRIHKRLHDRLKRGMLAEAKKLHAQGLSYKRMESLGLEYRSLGRFLQKKISRAQLESELQSAIWRYARRQISYWRRNKDIRWFTQEKTRGVEHAVAKWLKT